jgi:hypothetical protein
LERYIRTIANALGLRDWEIKLSDETCEDGYYDTITPQQNHKSATIRLSKDWFKLDAADQRDSIIHELLHLHQVGTRDIVEYDIPNYVSDDVGSLLMSGVIRAMELSVSTLTAAIAPKFPLIDWGMPVGSLVFNQQFPPFYHGLLG